MNKILVADDEADLEALIVQKFRKEIREGLLEFVFAENGQVALDKIAEHGDIDMVLSDINMPEMDGLTFLSKLQQTDPLIKTVIVSAYGDMDNIRTAMNRGAFDFITKPINFEDLKLTIDKTTSHVQSLKNTLKALKENNILKMYVDENVLQFMGTKEFEHSLSENETIEATVAFIDICGFTSISENESPDTVIDLLNHYFDIIVNEIIQHSGRVDKFIGDAVMAVFQGENHELNAIKASIKIKNSLPSYPFSISGKSICPKLSFGINSGSMVAGNVGSKTLKRLDFTVIGDVVNTAQRLQSMAIPGQILISSALFNKGQAHFNLEYVGELAFKNKSNTEKVYSVI